MISLKVLLVCAFIAVVQSQSVSLEPYYNTYNSSASHVDNYLEAHRRIYLSNIWLYDLKIENFKTLFIERINTLSIHQSLLIDSLVQTYEHLIPLELLSETNKECVQKYKKLIPPVSAVKYDMELCITSAKNQLSSIIINPSNTNKTLQTYYLNTFEKAVQTCQKTYPAAIKNYTICIENAITAANVYTIANQKTFGTQMDTSDNSAQLYVKRAMECSWNVHNTTISSNTQGSTLIDRCIRGMDYCNRCTGYYCENVYYMPAASVDPNNRSMTNIFYGNNEKVKCMMLDLY